MDGLIRFGRDVSVDLLAGHQGHPWNRAPRTHHASNNVSWLIQRPSLVNFWRLLIFFPRQPSHRITRRRIHLGAFLQDPPCRSQLVHHITDRLLPQTYNYISAADAAIPANLARDSWTSFAPTSDNMLIWPTAAGCPAAIRDVRILKLIRSSLSIRAVA